MAKNMFSWDILDISFKMKEKEVSSDDFLKKFLEVVS